MNRERKLHDIRNDKYDYNNIATQLEQSNNKKNSENSNKKKLYNIKNNRYEDRYV